MKFKDKRLCDFSVIIRNRRIELGYSSAERFANDHKLNRSVYQRWENGEDLNLSSLMRLLDILKMSGKMLFEKWEKANIHMPQDREVDLSLVAERKEMYKGRRRKKKMPEE